MRHLPIVSAALLLTACTTTMADPPMAQPLPADSAQCNDAAARPMVGQEATPAVVERARELAGARTARVLEPGQMVTMEYLPGRLNIYVDERNVIERIHCG